MVLPAVNPTDVLPPPVDFVDVGLSKHTSAKVGYAYVSVVTDLRVCDKSPVVAT